MGVYLINFLVYSMAMVGLLFVCLMVYKKTMLNNKCAKNPQELAVENALTLSQRKTLYVVKAGNEKFLIAADVDRTSFLAKLNNNEDIQNTMAPNSLPAVQPTVKNAQAPSNAQSKSVDYSEVMSAIRSSKRKQPIMREMLQKLSEPILKDNK